LCATGKAASAAVISLVARIRPRDDRVRSGNGVRWYDEHELTAACGPFSGVTDVPFEFLRRIRKVELDLPGEPVPEELSAEDYELRLLYRGRSSEAVRIAAGSITVDHLPSMVQAVAQGPIEVIEPVPVELGNAAPRIERPLEAEEWLAAHASDSPVSRHAIMVLELVGAIDMAFESLALCLLYGEIDTAGYPEFNAVVGGVAAHWDEATGDLLVRGIVAWGGRGVRGGSDRAAQRALANIVSSILTSQRGLEMVTVERPVPAAGPGGLVCASCGFASADERAFYCPRCGVRLIRG
jgi:hypothetical protein